MIVAGKNDWTEASPSSGRRDHPSLDLPALDRAVKPAVGAGGAIVTQHEVLRLAENKDGGSLLGKSINSFSQVRLNEDAMVDEDVTALQQLVGAYHDRAARFPRTFSEMVSAGVIRDIPLDPLRHPYRLEPGGVVVVSNPDDLPFLDKGVPSGYVPHAAPKLFPAR